MASVTERIGRHGGITWRVQFRIDGRMSSESFKDQRQAVRFGNLVDKIGGTKAREILLVQQSPTSLPTLTEWTGRYLDPASGMLSGVTEGTRADYVRIAHRTFLVHPIGELPLDMISHDEVAQWVTWQEAQHTLRSVRAHDRDKTKPLVKMSAKSVRLAQGLLSQILESAVSHELIPRNQAKGIRLTKGRKAQMTFLTPAEFHVVLACTPDEWKPLVEFLAVSGARFGEVTALTFADLHPETTPPTVTIDKGWQKAAHGVELGAPKTSRSNRTISLPEQIIAKLGTGHNSALIFHSATGKPVDRGHFWTRVWKPTVARANDPEYCSQRGLAPISKQPRIHDLRHSHASWLIAQGVPLTVLQRRLGHESIQTSSDRYGHLMPDVQSIPIAALESALAISATRP